MPRISAHDFLELKISIESIIDDLSQEEKKVEEDFKKSIEEYVVQKDEQYYVNIASLNHSIGTARQNILSSANIISNYISYSIDDPIVSDFVNKFKSDNGYDFIELPNGIRNDIGLISRTLKNGFEGLKVENYVKESVPVLEIPNIIEKLNRPGYNFRLILKSEIEDENKSRLSINTDLFNILIANIFENAHKHGFTTKSDENIVEVELYQIGHMVTIGISNNGLPFPDGFTQEQFEQKYTLSAESKGTGIGGYDIKRIINYFGGNLTLLTDRLAKDSVEFLINLPEEFLTYEEE
jgi:type I restriction enzyme M protein